MSVDYGKVQEVAEAIDLELQRIADDPALNPETHSLEGGLLWVTSPFRGARCDRVGRNVRVYLDRRTYRTLSLDEARDFLLLLQDGYVYDWKGLAYAEMVYGPDDRSGPVRAILERALQDITEEAASIRLVAAVEKIAAERGIRQPLRSFHP